MFQSLSVIIFSGNVQTHIGQAGSTKGFILSASLEACSDVKVMYRLKKLKGWNVMIYKPGTVIRGQGKLPWAHIMESLRKELRIDFMILS